MSASDARLAAEILAQFTDSASARFDQALGAMPLDDDQRRELKYWQRQSLAAQRQYAAIALPGAFAAVAAARQDALDSAEAAARTWADARSALSAEPAQITLELRRRSVAARLASGA